MLGETNGQHPKVFGELGLGTSQLAEDVKKAKAQLKSLSDAAKKLGEEFKAFGVPNGLVNTATGLENVAKDLKVVTEDIAKQFEDGSKKVKQAKDKLVNTLSHEFSVGRLDAKEAQDRITAHIAQLKQASGGAITPEIVNAEALFQRISSTVAGQYQRVTEKAKKLRVDEAQAWSKTLADQALGNRKLGNANNDVGYRNDLQRLIASNDVIFKDKQRLAVELNKVNQKIENDELSVINQVEISRKEANAQAQREIKAMFEDKRQALKAELDADKERYKQGEIDHLAYIERLRQINKQAQIVFTPRELNQVKKETNRVVNNIDSANDKQSQEAYLSVQSLYAQRSKELTDTAIRQRQLGYITDREAHKTYLQQLLNDERISYADRQRLEKEYVSYVKTSYREQLNEERRLLSEKSALEKTALAESQRRFRSLSNYAFDATLIYGSIQGLTKMVDTIKQVETGAENLARIMPQATTFDIKNITKDAFDIGMTTAQNVTDVQKIQNLWARTSDEIANSKEAMKELSETTAVALNVGGFTDAEQAVSLLNGAINQMGLDWTDSRKVLDGWIKVADTTAVTSAKDLAENVMRVGSQAKLLGINMDELNAIAGIFANNMSKSGEEIGTAMKTVFSYFQDDKTIKVLEKYGVEVKKNAKEFNNFGTIMDQLNKKVNELNLDNNQQALHQIYDALGRIRRVDYVGTLLQHWDETKSIMMDSMNAQGYAMEQNDKIMSTYDKQVGKLQVSMQLLAHSIGESGLLEDMKSLVQALISGVDWFNNLDPATKAFALRLAELSGLFLLVSKSTQLLTGVGLTKFIANTIGEIALMSNSTKLLTVAQRLKVEFDYQEVASTSAKNVALMANSAETMANTVAQQANNIVEAEGAVIEEANTVTTTVNTVAKEANAVASGEAAAAETALNAVRVAGTGGMGLMSAAAGALLNPITAIIGVVGLAAAGFYAFSQSQKASAEQTKANAQAQKELNEAMNGRIIPDAKVDAEKERLTNIEDLRKQMMDEITALNKEFADQQAQAKNMQNPPTGIAALTTNIQNLSGASAGISQLTAQILQMTLASKKQNVFADYESQFEALGTTSKDAATNITQLSDAITRSENPFNKNAMKLIQSIENQQRDNNQIRVKIARYIELSKTITTAAQVTGEYAEYNATLAQYFPQYADGIDNNTGLQKINTAELIKAVGATGELTKAQISEIEMMARLDEASKQAALDIINHDIEMTKSKQETTLSRIQMMEQESNALAKLAGIPSLNTVTGGFGLGGLTPDMIKAIVTPEVVGLLKANGFYEYMNTEDPKAVYNYLKGQGKDYLLSPDAIKAMKAASTQKINLEQEKAIIEAIKPFDPNNIKDTPIAGDGSKTKTKNTYKAEYDRYVNLKLALEGVNSELDLNKKLQDSATPEEKIRLEMEEISLLKSKQSALHDYNVEQKKELDEVKNTLSKKFGVAINKFGEFTNLKARIGKYQDDQARELEKLVSTYSDLVKSIPEKSGEWRDIQNKIDKINDDMVKNRLDTAKTVEDKILEIVKKRIQDQLETEKKAIKVKQDAEDERHKRALKALEDEKKLNDKIWDAQSKAIDRQNSTDDYTTQLTDLEKQRSELLQQFNVASLDNSVEGRTKAKDLKKQLGDVDKQIEKTKHDRETELRKNNIDDQKEAYQENYDNKVEAENQISEVIKKALQDELTNLEETYKKKLEAGALYQETYRVMTKSTFDELSNMITTFEDNFGSGLSTVGGKIKSELIDKLTEALSLMQAVGYKGGGNLDDLVNKTKTADQVNLLLYRQSVNYNIAKQQGNTTAMKAAHDEAERIRKQTGRPSSDDGGTDTIFLDWLKKNNLDPTKMASLDTGGMLQFDSARTQGKLIMAHNGEVVNNPIQTRELLLTSLAIKSTIPQLDSLMTAVKGGGANQVNIGNLLNIDGDVATRNLNDVQGFAELVFEKLYEKLKVAGVV